MSDTPYVPEGATHYTYVSIKYKAPEYTFYRVRPDYTDMWHPNIRLWVVCGVVPDLRPI